MDFQINRKKPLIMHIDLNSCFATVEQQANPLLRGKPLVVAAYTTPNACIVAPSIEAKRLGIKTGMRIRDAWEIDRNINIRMPDPPKYRDVHTKFKKIFKDYTDDVTPKSIDEAVLDFTEMESLDLVKIAKEIKGRIRSEIGEWMSCSVGISTNMFLAKLAASLKKPDGLIVIDHKTLEYVYKNVELLDFCGINVRYQARLNAWGIYTPMDFFNAPRELLAKRVFQSVVGDYWFQKLRGYEADEKEFKTKSYGNQYALRIPTANKDELARLLMKLCEKSGRRMRRNGYKARGVHMWFAYSDYMRWHMGRQINKDLYSTLDIFNHAMNIFDFQPQVKKITHMGISSYKLAEYNSLQLEIFEEFTPRAWKVTDAMDEINDKYGEFTVVQGNMMSMDDQILDRIAFGGVKELEDLYAGV